MEETKKRMSKSKKIILIVGISIFSFVVINIIGLLIACPLIYNSIFIHYDEPDYNIVPGLINYEDIKDIYTRKDITFSSNKNKLQGHLYEANTNEHGLIIFAHGMGSGADTYLSHELYLLNSGFNIFTFDFTGTYKSEGNTVLGFPEATIDIGNAIDFINSNYSNLTKNGLFLMGHSWGSYAATTILNIKNNIKGVVSLSGANSAEEVVLDKAQKYVGILADMSSPFVYSYQESLFSKFAKYSSVNGLNNSKTSCLIVQGNNDYTFKTNKVSTYSHKSDITSSKVIYKLISGEYSGHTSLLYSDNANIYRNEVDNKLNDLESNYEGEILYNKKKELCNNIDDKLYSEVNSELMLDIVKFLKGA